MEKIRRGKLIAAGMVVAVLCLFALWPAAASVPQLPCTFYGSVTLDGSAVPDGTVIRARLTDNSLVGNATTSGSEYMMIVPQDPDTGKPAEGAVLNFYVVSGSNEYLGGTSTWNAGGVKQVNLSAVSGAGCEDNPAVAAGLESIYGRLVAVYGFRAGEGVGGWTLFRPDWATSHPEWNTLSRLYQGRGYWVLVNADCQLTYGSWNTPGNPLASYNLNNGWNLIGWMGC